MPPIRVEYFFDVLSPYTAFSWSALQRYAKLWDLEVKLVPFFLGGVMRSTNNKPPATVAAKGKYMFSDLPLNAKMFGTKMLPIPTNFFNEFARESILLQRILVASQQDARVSEEQVHALVTSFTHLAHGEESYRDQDNNIKLGPSMVLEACREAGLSDSLGRELIEKASTSEVKKQLIANTERGVQLGAFGSPTLVVYHQGLDKTPHLFFGSDRFELMAFLLGKEYKGVHPRL